MDLETNAAGKREVLVSGVHGRPLVARIWFGRTHKELADEYLRYNYEDGLLEIEGKPGNLGVQSFRKVRGAVAEFTTISYWPSVEVMAAAMDKDGDDARRVSHLEKDPEYLLELPEAVEVSELHVNDWRLEPGSSGRR
jgi:hypothetical protein